MISHVGLCFARCGGRLLEARVLVSILQLVQRLLATVKFADAAHIPRIDEQVLLDCHVERAIGRERRREVDLQHPRFQI